MFKDPALQRLENTILTGKLYNASENVIGIAKDNGFEICNVNMDTADGFIYVSEDKENNVKKSRKTIGVNSKNSLKRKKAFIAQELSRYYLAKLKNEEKSLEIAQRDTLVLNKIDFENNVYFHVTDQENNEWTKINEEDRSRELANSTVKDRLIENYKAFFTNILSLIKTDKALQIESSAIKELLSYQIVKVGNDTELRKDQFQSDIERERDEQVTTLFEGYINAYIQKEEKKIKYRGVLFAFCIISASLIIAISLGMLIVGLVLVSNQNKEDLSSSSTVTDMTPAPSTEGFRLERILFSVAEATGEKEDTVGNEIENSSAVMENNDVSEIENYVDSVLSSNTSTATKDIVAIISICVTILGSIFGLLKMIAKYVLPTDEEKSMQEIVKIIQKNDFKHEVVQRLYEAKLCKEIVQYLNKSDAVDESENQNPSIPRNTTRTNNQQNV
jgi:hypothetical protein